MPRIAPLCEIAGIANKSARFRSVRQFGQFVRGNRGRDISRPAARVRGIGTLVIVGVKVDQHGNVYVIGPDGLWIIDATGKHLGTLRGPELPHNMAWATKDAPSTSLPKPASAGFG